MSLASFGNRIRSATKLFHQKPDKDDTSGGPPAEPVPRPFETSANPHAAGATRVSMAATKVFKQKLDPHATEIPNIVKKCVEYIERCGTTIVGVFRLSGSHEELQELVMRFDSGEDVDLTKCDPLVVAALLKRFLRDMPEPLITYEWYDALLASVGIKDQQVQLNEVKKVVNFLPEGNKLLLSYLLGFLHRFVRHEKVTLMTSQNLAIVFAPNILRAENMSIEEEIQDSVYTNALVMLLIEKFPDIFEGHHQAEPSNTASLGPPGLKRELSGGKSGPPPAIPPKPAAPRGLIRATSTGNIASQPPLPPKPQPKSPQPTQTNIPVRIDRSSTSAPAVAQARSSPNLASPAPPPKPSKPLDAVNSPASPPVAKRPLPKRTVIATHARSQSADVAPNPLPRPVPPPRPQSPSTVPDTSEQDIPISRPASKPPAFLVNRAASGDITPAAPRQQFSPQRSDPQAKSRFRVGSRHTYAPGSITASSIEAAGPPPALPRKLSSTNPFLASPSNPTPL